MYVPPQPHIEDEGPIARACAGAPARRRRAGAAATAGGGSLVTSRNNSDRTSGTVLEVPRPYVAACCSATLAVHRASSVRFGALTCGSWSCPHCRRVLAARTLDRLRSGLEARAGHRLTLLTLTLDPAAFGAHRIGSHLWDDGRETNLWSEPTREQFAAAVAAMSDAFAGMMDRLNVRRRGPERFGYFRVVELHRNLWPHYHVLVAHPDLELEADDLGWELGICDARAVDVDTAVGELAPYLVATESKAGGSKAYQFAARALPKGFRLYTQSRGFLGPSGVADEQAEPVDAALVLRGHFTSYHQQARDWGAESRLALKPPTEPNRPHRPPSAAIATGDGAVVLFAELAEARALHLEPARLHASRVLLSGRANDEGPAPHRAGPVLPLPSDLDEPL